MCKRLVCCLAMAFALSWASSATAANVWLLPLTPTVAQGEDFYVRLYMSAEDAPGDHDPALITGAVLVDYAASLADYVSFSTFDPAVLDGSPLVGLTGANETVKFEFDEASDFAPVGDFVFRAMGSPGDVINFGLNDPRDRIISSFINIVGTNKTFAPNFFDASVTIIPIPLPAAGWLMLSALGLIGSRARRRRH
ncbi:MAG: VPLPA-CTERM sorting domain-containing protein [Gammaproteobacteria bacterium]